MEHTHDQEWARFFLTVGEIINLPGYAKEKAAHLKKAIDEWEEESNMMELCAMLQSIYPDV